MKTPLLCCGLVLLTPFLNLQDGCGSTGEDTPTPAPGDTLAPLDDGCGHQLIVELDPFALRLETTEGVRLSRLLPGGLRIGSVPEIDPSYNYDPYMFYQHLFPEATQGPDGLEWLSATRVTASQAVEGGLSLDLELSNGGIATLSVSSSCPSAFTISVNAPEIPTAYVGIDFSAPDDERYYGLGEYFDTAQHRGQLRALQFEVAPEQEDYYNEAHVPVPFLISTAGWGVYVQDYHDGIFDVASTTADKVRIEYGARDLTFSWMAADRPLDLVATYTGLSGAPAMPPVWSFAPIQWRDEVSGQEMVLDDARAIRDNGIPGAGIWLDRPYATYATAMDFDPSKYPDPAAMVQQLHDSGFQMAAWCAPYLDENDPDFQLAQQSGWLVGGYTAATTDFGWLVDLTHPGAKEFWMNRVTSAIEMGFNGWKMDYGEDIISGAGDEAMHLEFYNGEGADTMHHRFSEYYHQAFFEPYQPGDVFIISRTGTLGGQQWTSVIWPGDLCNDFYYYGEEGHVGGLPAAMIAGNSLAASGYPFYASDTGGYKHGRASSEVLLRWAQYSAFLPIMQYGGCGDVDPSCNPWDFSDQGDKTYTEETLEVFRTYARFHIELFPYFYRLAERARDAHLPPSAGFGLYWPNDGRDPQDEMIVGDGLLVAPLVRGGTSRTVYLPEGRFVDYWTGNRVSGPSEFTVEVPIDQVPLYFLDGAIVPMLRPGVQTLDPVTDTSIDSWATDAGRVWGYVVPGSRLTSFDLPFDGGTLSTREDTPPWLSFSRSSSGTRFEGINLRVYAPDATSVSRDGAGLLTQVQPGETATCSGCWARESGSPWVWVGLDDLEGWTLRFNP